ncbi:hypothetical protein BDZ89DRAFT_1072639, partial [Hymenopellis radicata]
MDDPISAPGVFPTEIFEEIIFHVALSKRPPWRDPDSPAASDERRRTRHRLQNLRLVSSEFNKLAADYLFYRLTVGREWTRLSCGQQNDLWRALADGSTSCLGGSVRWIYITLGIFSGEQHLACINNILVGLATLPRVPLRALTITMISSSDDCCVFPSIGGFTDLRRLTILHPLDANMVSALIADNPHLSTLTIGGRSNFSIGEVLPSLPSDADRCLKVLSLEELTFLAG